MIFSKKTPEEKSKILNEIVKGLLATLLIFIVIGFVHILRNLLGEESFNNITLLLYIIIIGITLLIIVIKAGFTVLKSLFFMAAEISLLIFLSQSYCAVNRTALSDSALKNLLIIGLLYIIINFLHSLWKKMHEEYKSSKGDKSWENIAFIITFIAFVIFFIWQIYLVIDPIIQNLCILI